jgi:hypothetical protein
MPSCRTQVRMRVLDAAAPRSAQLRGAMPSMRITLQDSLLSFVTVANDSDSPSLAGMP